tara:strand:+ start:271 stop:735 length:465 start_codon:yes stop_codon:yes gene_type:complete
MWQELLKLKSKLYILGNEIKFEIPPIANDGVDANRKLTYQKRIKHFPEVKKVIEGVYEKIKRTPIDNMDLYKVEYSYWKKDILFLFNTEKTGVITIAFAPDYLFKNIRVKIITEHPKANNQLWGNENFKISVEDTIQDIFNFINKVVEEIYLEE